jgi:hypothetical protein
MAQAKTLNISNYSDVDLGLSSAPDTDVTVVRNYLAHPNTYTLAAYRPLAMRLGVSGASTDQLLRFRLPGGGTQFEAWVKLYQIAAENAIK